MTQAQRSLLAKRPNYAIASRHTPHLEYITAIELVCPKLSQQDADEPRADVNMVLQISHLPKSNLSKAEVQAIKELERNKVRIILAANKGVAMVVMDKQDYINKFINLLTHPTNKIKAKLITILRTIKKETGLNNNTYKYMYPMECSAPKFYGHPKIYKSDTLLRPIVSSRGLVTYRVAKILTKIF